MYEGFPYFSPRMCFIAAWVKVTFQQVGPFRKLNEPRIYMEVKPEVSCHRPLLISIREANQIYSKLRDTLTAVLFHNFKIFWKITTNYIGLYIFYALSFDRILQIDR